MIAGPTSKFQEVGLILTENHLYLLFDMRKTAVYFLSGAQIFFFFRPTSKFQEVGLILTYQSTD